MTRDTITITEPVAATLWVQDRGPAIKFGTTTVKPGTYKVEEIDPPDPSVGLWSGAITVELAEDTFAEIDWDDVVEAV